MALPPLTLVVKFYVEGNKGFASKRASAKQDIDRKQRTLIGSSLKIVYLEGPLLEVSPPKRSSAQPIQI